MESTTNNINIGAAQSTKETTNTMAPDVQPQPAAGSFKKK